MIGCFDAKGDSPAELSLEAANSSLIIIDGQHATEHCGVLEQRWLENPQLRQQAAPDSRGARS